MREDLKLQSESESLGWVSIRHRIDEGNITK